MHDSFENDTGIKQFLIGDMTVFHVWWDNVSICTCDRDILLSEKHSYYVYTHFILLMSVISIFLIVSVGQKHIYTVYNSLNRKITACIFK